MIALLSGLVIGLACGVISGLIPGIHSNTMAGIMVGISPALIAFIGAEGLAAALISMLISHSFLDLIPSTFFGVPDSGTALSVLPAHALALEGKGEEAVRLSAIGCAYGVIFGVPVSVIAYFVLVQIQSSIDWFTGPVLVLIMGLIIIQEESVIWGLLLFVSSGLLGLFAFRYQYLVWGMNGESTVLMPLLTGLFGLSVLISSSHAPVPRQRFSDLGLESGKILYASLSGTVAGLLVGWLPGLSTASATAVINARIKYDTNRRTYLVAAGAAACANVVVGLAAFYGIERTRNGVMVMISSLDPPSFWVLLLVTVTASVAAYLITLWLATYARWFSGVDGKKLNTLVSGFVIILCGFISGPFGLFILACATGIGLIPVLLNLSRVTCMGVVTLPVILYSLGLWGF